MPTPGSPAPVEYAQRPYAPPPGALDLLLVRHGESAPFIPGQNFPLVGGHGDPPLAPGGRTQAERVADRLTSEHQDGRHLGAIYVTTLQRTAQTAEPLARRTGLAPRVEADLREVMLGDWEGGVFRQKVAEADPIALRMMEEQRWDVIPGAENGEAFAARIRAAVSRLAAAHPDQRVAAFTHGGVIGEILRQATGSVPFAFVGPDNGSISQILVIGDRWVVRRFNDTAHLAAGFTTASAPPT